MLFLNWEESSYIFFELTCAIAWWAHMHRFLSVRMSVCDWTKIPGQKLLDNNSYIGNRLS